MALKARVLLYAASPLFNGNGPPADADVKELVGYPSHDPERWKKAADAAKAIINANFYELYEDNATAPGFGFSKVFTLRKNSEYILRSEEHTSELQSLMRISYAVFCLKK